MLRVSLSLRSKRELCGGLGKSPDHLLMGRATLGARSPNSPWKREAGQRGPREHATWPVGEMGAKGVLGCDR